MNDFIKSVDNLSWIVTTAAKRTTIWPLLIDSNSFHIFFIFREQDWLRKWKHYHCWARCRKGLCPINFDNQSIHIGQWGPHFRVRCHPIGHKAHPVHDGNRWLSARVLHGLSAVETFLVKTLLLAQVSLQGAGSSREKVLRVVYSCHCVSQQFRTGRLTWQLTLKSSVFMVSSGSQLSFPACYFMKETVIQMSKTM